MRKVMCLLVVVLCTALTSCSWLEDKSVKPNIIGVGNLQYDAERNLCVVFIDSVQYSISQVIIPNGKKGIQTLSNPHDIALLNGVEMTVFTTDNKIGVQAAGGMLSEEQIIELVQYRSPVGVIIGLLVMFFLVVVWLFDDLIRERKKAKKSENAA